MSRWRRPGGGRLRRWRLPIIALPEKLEKAGPPSATATYYLILVPVVALILVGLVMVFSASAVAAISAGANPYQAFLRDLVIMVGGIILMVVASMLPEKFWRWFALPIWGVTLVVQFAVLSPLGVEIGGNRNWLRIPGIGLTIQPSEALKLGLVLLLAKAFSSANIKAENVLQMGINAGVPILLSIGGVMAGRDMGTALVFAGFAVAMLLAKGIPTKWYLFMALPVVGFLSYFVLREPSRINRVFDMIPGVGAPPSPAEPRQIDHSLWALGSGGLSGLGPGASREKWNYLQAAESDFIFAIFGEEFGLLGTLAVLACFVAMAVGFYRLSVYHQSPFARFVATGVGAWITVQAIINLAMVVDLGPVIGVPLPLVSTGGSAFVLTATALGIVLGCARRDENIESAFGVPALLSRARLKSLNKSS